MKNILSIILFFGLLGANIFAQAKWDYPTKPGSDKWKSFTTHQQMVDACKIPQTILEQMNTAELLEAWESFPLKLDVIAFNSPQQGFEVQKKISTTLKSLLSRKDAGEVVLKRYKEAKNVEQQIYAKEHPKISINDYWMLKLLLSQAEITSKITDICDKNFVQKELSSVKSLGKTTSSLDIRTPRGTYVPNTVRSDGADDPWEPWVFDVAGTDKYCRETYPQATLISSSTRTYNCHSYAWADGYSNRCWINTPSDDLYWTDGSYDYLSESVATHVSYSGDHSATTTGTPDVYISKWGPAPLMQHHKGYCPDGYGSPSQFFRRSVDIPEDQSSINSAVSAAVSGQSINVSPGNYTLTGNASLSSGVTLNLLSGANVNFNGYYIDQSSGTFNIQNGSTVHLRNGGQYYGLYTSIQPAIDNTTSNRTIEVLGSSYAENLSFSSKSYVTLYGQGSFTLNGGISVTNSSYVTVSGLTMSGALSLNNSSNTNLSSATITGTTIASDYGGTMTAIGSVSANNIGASFGLYSYGGTGDFFSSSVSTGDCAVYLTNYLNFR